MRYCQFCGTKLEDGQQCTCQEAQEAAKQEAAAQEAAGQKSQNQKDEVQQKMADAQRKAKDAAVGLWSYLKAYFASPAQAVQENAAQKGITVSLLLTVIRVLSMGLAVFGVLNNLCNSFSGSISSAFNTYEIKVSAPFLGSLLYGGLIAAVGMALFILGIFAVVKQQGGSLSLRGAWQASAGNGVLPTALLLVSFLLSFMSVPLALAFVALSVMASLTFGALTIQFVHTKNSSGLFWLIYFVAVVVIVGVCRYAVPELLLKAVGGITVSYRDESSTIGPVIDKMKDSFNSETLKDTFDQIVQQILRNVSF